MRSGSELQDILDSSYLDNARKLGALSDQHQLRRKIDPHNALVVVFTPEDQEPRELVVEVADTPPKRSRGLMHRTSVQPYQGMLFRFHYLGRQRMWMKNTPLSLDMIFIDSGRKEVVGVVHQTKPYSLDESGVDEVSDHVLEVPAGMARRLRIKKGTKVSFRKWRLMEKEALSKQALVTGGIPLGTALDTEKHRRTLSTVQHDQRALGNLYRRFLPGISPPRTAQQEFMEEVNKLPIQPTADYMYSSGEGAAYRYPIGSVMSFGHTTPPPGTMYAGRNVGFPSALERAYPEVRVEPSSAEFSGSNPGQPVMAFGGRALPPYMHPYQGYPSHPISIGEHEFYQSGRANYVPHLIGHEQTHLDPDIQSWQTRGISRNRPPRRPDPSNWGYESLADYRGILKGLAQGTIDPNRHRSHLRTVRDTSHHDDLVAGYVTHPPGLFRHRIQEQALQDAERYGIQGAYQRSMYDPDMPNRLNQGINPESLYLENLVRGQAAEAGRQPALSPDFHMPSREPPPVGPIRLRESPEPPLRDPTTPYQTDSADRRITSRWTEAVYDREVGPAERARLYTPSMGEQGSLAGNAQRVGAPLVEGTRRAVGGALGSVGRLFGLGHERASQAAEQIEPPVPTGEVVKEGSAALRAQEQVTGFYPRLREWLLSDDPIKNIRGNWEEIAKDIPELGAEKGCAQDPKSHRFDVLGHSLEAVSRAPKEEVLRVAALFHDIGKPATKIVDDKGINQFPDHAHVGARITAKVLERIGAPENIRKKVPPLIYEHYIMYKPGWSDRKVDTVAKRVGLGVQVDRLEQLGKADIDAHRRSNPHLEEYHEQLSGLADRMRRLGLEKGAEFPRILIVGASGSGKTTVADKLHAKYPSARLVHLDDIWDAAKKVHPDVDTVDAPHSPEMMATVRDLRAKMLKQTKAPLIMEGMGERSDGPIRRSGAVVFRVNTPPLVSTIRALKRGREHGESVFDTIKRFPGHWMTNRERAKVLDESGFEPLSPRQIMQRAGALLGEKKAAEFAPGISSKTRFEPIPEVSGTPAKWDRVIQKHDAARAGSHFDLRLGDPATGHSHSWAIKKMPAPGKATYAPFQPTHQIEYHGFEGTIPAGTYGAGEVKTEQRSMVEVTKASDNEVRFVIPEGRIPEQFVLKRQPTGGGKMWTLHNTTPTRAVGKWDTLIPIGKPPMKSKLPSAVDTSDPGTVLQPKIDGAHVVAVLEGGKPLRLFSHRQARNETGLIEHTYRDPEYWKKLAPEGLKPTVIRGELWASDKSGKPVPLQDLSGILNSSIPEARKRLSERGLKLRVSVHGVDRMDGRKVDRLPFDRVDQFLKNLVDQVPGLEHIQTARTPAQKKALLGRILKGKHPLTSEGVVEYRTASPEAVKVKAYDPHDVYIREVYEGTRPGEAGGFRYSHTPTGKIVGAVGTGLTRTQRKEMLESPGKWLGRVAKVKAQEKLRSGALRAPAFEELHLEKGLQPYHELG